MSGISIKNLTKKFKTVTAVNDLSFEVTKNHVVGFLGPNGAGKTTTLRMLVGLSKPTEGTIKIGDISVNFGNSVTNNKICYLPELPSFYNWMTGTEYLEFIADIFKISKSKKSSKIFELFKTVNLTDAKDNRISTYSGGMKQCLGIAQALLNDPEVIILDEPVSSLDPIGRKEVLTVIGKLKGNRTVLFSTHILSDVDKICDDIVIINKGKLVISKPLAELKEEYATSILEVEFVSDAKKVAQNLKNEPWIKKMEQKRNFLKIWLTDNGVFEKNIPFEYFAKQKLGVLSYGLKLPEVEDLFIELLGEKNE